MSESSDLLLREGLEGEIRKRIASPQGQGSCEHLGAFVGRLSVCESHEQLELHRVELLGSDPQTVPGRSRLDHVGAQELAEARDPVVKGCHRGPRRMLVSERVQQRLAGDDLIDPKQQRGEQRPLLRATQIHQPVVACDFEWSVSGIAAQPGGCNRWRNPCLSAAWSRRRSMFARRSRRNPGNPWTCSYPRGVQVLVLGTGESAV